MSGARASGYVRLLSELVTQMKISPGKAVECIRPHERRVVSVLGRSIAPMLLAWSIVGATACNALLGNEDAQLAPMPDGDAGGISSGGSSSGTSGAGTGSSSAGEGGAGSTGSSSSGGGTTGTTGSRGTTGMSGTTGGTSSTTGTGTSTGGGMDAGTGGGNDAGATSSGSGGDGGGKDAARPDGPVDGSSSAGQDASVGEGGADAAAGDGASGGGGNDAPADDGSSAGQDAAGDGAASGDGSIDGGAPGDGAVDGADDTPPPCLELLSTRGDFDAAAQSLTVIDEDFSRDAQGNVTQYAVVGGDYFYQHANVTFQSFATSDQAAPGTVSDLVVGHPDTTSVSSIIGSYDGFDGIRSRFTDPQVVVGITLTAGTPDPFLLAVTSSADAGSMTWTVPSGTTFVGIRSHCGAIVESVDLSPQPLAGGSHNSIYWQMNDLSFAR